VDFSAASWTLPFKSGTAAPASCQVGEAFFKTDAEPGKNLLLCTAPNSWTVVSRNDLSDLVPTVNGNVVTISAGKARIGNQTYAISQGTVTFSAGSGDCKTFVSEQGALTTECAGGITGTAGGSMTLANVGTPAFPAGSIPLANLTLSSGTPSLDSDQRAAISTKALQAGSGISLSDNGGITSIATDSTRIPTLAGANSFSGENDFSGAAKFRVRSGSGLPPAAGCDEAAEVGGIYVRSDAAGSNASHYVCSNTAPLTYAWELTQSSGSGLNDAYATITDGTNPAAASGSDTFKLRTGNDRLSIVTGHNDPTHGDNALFTVNEGNIDHQNLSGAGTNSHSAIDTHLAASAPHSGHEQTANKGVAGGYASLDTGAMIPDNQIPAAITRDSEVDVQGTANEIASTGSGVAPTLSIADTFRITGKTATAPVKTGTTAPPNCTVGDLFYDTDATVGQNLFGCTALDTWTLLGDGGGAGAVSSVFGRTGDVIAVAGDYTAEQLGDFIPSVASNILTIAAGKASIGSQPYSIVEGTVTYTDASGSGDCKVFLSDQGILTTHCVTGIAATPGGSMVYAQVTNPAYPAGSKAIADLTITGGTPATITIDSDDRTFFDGSSVRAGTGITVTTAAGVQEVNTDPTVIPTFAGINAFTGESDFSAATKLRLRTGSGTPPGVTCDEAAEVGSVYMRSDAQAVNASLFVCSQTGSGTYAWELAQSAGGSGGGDVSSNTSTSVDGEIALFSGSGGKTIQRATGSGVAKITNGVLSTVTGSALDCVKVDGTSGACGTGGSSDPFDRSVARWVEEFASGLATAGNVGSLGWTFSNNNGSSSVSLLEGEADHPGIVKVKTGTTSGNDSSMALRNGIGVNDIARFDNTAGWEFQWLVRPTQVTDVAHWIGLGAYGQPFASSGSIAVKFDTNASDATWIFQNCNGTCGTAASTVTPVAGTWYLIRIRSLVAGTILFSVNGESEVSISSNLPTATLSPGISVRTRTAAESSLDVDWFAGQMTVTR